ncbi:MAG: replicative DNA helicase, partial [Legionellales bacterium]
MADVSILKIPPHSLEAEQAVLGGLLLDNAAWDRIATVVSEHDFYRQDHQLIFCALATLGQQNKPLDIITVSEFLEQQGSIDAAGGLAYLGKLAKNTPSAANIKAYAEIVRERSVLRKLVTVGGEIADAAFAPKGREVADLLDEAEQKVFAIADGGRGAETGPQKIADILASTVTKIEKLFESGNAITGLETGFTDFDKMTTGLQPSDLVIIAGRPSMGKTTFAMNIAEYAAMRNDAALKPVLMFSLEMPADALAMRLLSSLSRVEQQHIRTGQLGETDWASLTSAIGLLSTKKLFIDDSGTLTPMELRAKARRVSREHNGLSLIVIDYLQLMHVPGRGDNRVLEISEISRNLKSLARELNVPIIALSQLNRSLEQRTDKRPVMSDLRESGAIEQDADLIAFIYRDEVYNKESDDKGIAEIIIAKQRNGPI